MTKILFQMNLADMRAPYSDPLYDDFKVWLNALHALAEADTGFLWRYKGEDDDSGHIQPISLRAVDHGQPISLA